MDFGAFQNSAVVPFSGMQIRIFCGNAERDTKQLDNEDRTSLVEILLQQSSSCLKACGKNLLLQADLTHLHASFSKWYYEHLFLNSQ